MHNAYLGVDIGSISTKAVIIDDEYKVLASEYISTEGNPINATKNLLKILENKLNLNQYRIIGTGVTGSARQLVGVMLNATVIKNEITAHAMGTLSVHPDVRTILEIGGQDSKIILIEDGIAVDYAMNTLCAAGTGAFLSNQARRLGIRIEDMGDYALKSKNPTSIAARCAVFAESDIVHKIQVGHLKEDIVAGACKAIVSNYLNNVAKGKHIIQPVVFQGGVSKNKGVVAAFETALGHEVIVDVDGHLMGAIGVAILSQKSDVRREFNFRIANMEFKVCERKCGKCSNDCEIICAYRESEFIDAWGNRCERGLEDLGNGSKEEQI